MRIVLLDTLPPLPCCFLSIDPQSERHYDVSPYSYCAANPIRYMDPDGDDFIKRVRRNTITISAIYYADENSLASAEKAIDFWNSRKDDTYIDEQSGKTYNIRYDLTVRKNSITQNHSMDNTYTVVPGFIEKDRAGISLPTSHPKDIEVLSDYSIINPNTGNDSSTGAHEVGHTLGMKHSEKGIMSRTQDDSRTKDVLQENINQMMSSPLGQFDFISLFFK